MNIPVPFFSPLYLAVLALAVTAASAQDCKPRRVNRHKIVIVGSPGIAQRPLTAWTTRDGRYRLEHHADTLLVSKDGSPAYSLRVRAWEIISPYIAYEEGGEAWTDTLNSTGGKGATRRYFDRAFYSERVRATTNEARRSVRYYRASGKDSFFLVRHAAGMPKELTSYDIHGHDSLTQRWSAQGILHFRKTAAGGAERTYTLDGILHTHRFDTVGRRGFCFKEYYPSGSLRSVKYFFDREPVATWRYYDEDGRLTRAERKGAIPDTAGVHIVEAPPPPPEIFTFVDQYPEAPNNLTAMLTTKLTEVLCRSRVPLEGGYRVTFEIGEDGTPALTDVQGTNAAAILPDLKGIFTALPKWKPGKMNGRTVKTVMGVDFRVARKARKRWRTVGTDMPARKAWVVCSCQRRGPTHQPASTCLS